MMKKVNHLGMALFVFVSLTAALLWLTGNLRIGPAAALGTKESRSENGDGPDAAASAKANGEGKPAVVPGGNAGVTDFAALEAVQCEHGIRKFECDSCRFELGLVRLQPTLAQALVSTGVVEERDVAEVIRGTGQVRADPTRVVDVSPVGAGRVIEVRKALGDRVEQGDVLAVIHSSEFGEDKAAFIEARAKLQLAKRTVEREQQLYEKQISSEADYLDARKEFQGAEAQFAAAEKRLRFFGLDDAQIEAISTQKDNGRFAEIVLRAPRSGAITVQNCSEGKLADTTHDLFTIADLSNLWVWCDVYENNLESVRSGLAKHKSLEATVTVTAFPGTTFPGVVDLIGSEVDEQTRTIKVRVQVKSKATLLKPGMFAHVEMAVPREGKLLAVAEQAVLQDEGKSFVFMYWKDNLWMRRDVRTGRKQGRHVEILGGVPKGATVITSGAFMLKGDVLRAKMGAGCAD